MKGLLIEYANSALAAISYGCLALMVALLIARMAAFAGLIIVSLTGAFM